MAFLEQRIDPKITEGARGGPTNFGRTKTYMPGGKLRQNFAWSMPRHSYDISYGVKSAEYFESVLSLYYVVNFTPYEGFRYKDWRDFEATQANSTLTLITGATYQLQRAYTFASVTFKRDIKKPVSGTVTVYRTRASVVSVASASIDYTTGIATISGHVGGDTYTWTGEFDVPVTFVDDEWLADLEGSTENLFVASQPIKLEEIK